MKISALVTQQKDPNRVNIIVDGKYRFSLDVFQLVDLGVKVGKEYSEQELVELETESQFGKLYARALEYCLMRPHSAREVRDYLYRKTLPTKKIIRPRLSTTRAYEKAMTSSKGESVQKIIERPGVSQSVADRVYERLIEKGYIDDEKFARYWVENRNLTKGSSRRKLQAELTSKGVSREIVDRHLAETDRSDASELQKIIAKKRARYPDEQKFMHYLARQGFNYDDIKRALSGDES